MFVFILAGFALGFLAPWLQRLARDKAGWLFALFPLSATIYFANHIADVAAGRHFRTTLAWAPSLGIDLSFFLDGLSLLFALLISFVGVLVLIYGGGYLKGHPDISRFYSFLLIFMASMLGVVLSDNLITLFIFWELTSISSYFLIGFGHDRAEARAAALQALLVTGFGGLALLAGALLLGQAGGTFEISALLAQDGIRDHTLYPPILVLVLLGAFTKSAQTPFHFWLPNAMEAPAPVSAYLHAATMVKAGVYLLARMHPLLGDTQGWSYGVGGAGLLTMLVGAYVALKQTYFKRVLAYSTVSALGALVFLLGLGTPIAIQAAMVFLLSHALYKGALFLAAGAVDHETGQGDLSRLGGLRQAMPWTAAAASLAALSMAGLPPFFGFLAKEALIESAHEAPAAALFLTVLTVVAGLLTVTAAMIVGHGPFAGPLLETPKKPHEAPLSLWLGPLTLACLGLLAGLMPGIPGHWLLSAAAAAALGQPLSLDLKLWHGFSLTLLLSGIALAAGVALYTRWLAFREAAAAVDPSARWGPARWYEAALAGLNAFARAQTRFLQSGYLRYYVLLIIVAVMGTAGYTLLVRGQTALNTDLFDIRPHEAGLVLLLVVAPVAAVMAKTLLQAVVAVGATGYSIGIVFLLFGAPDLAMTQFIIETLTAIIFVLAFYRLPRFTQRSTASERRRDAWIAGASGALITALVMISAATQADPAISSYFVENSLTAAHGRNIVNVILVDFRGIDTLGEITVLAVAAVGVYALLRLRPGKGEGV
jgi:multicomponent Na+:H+ antiporter subunit A